MGLHLENEMATPRQLFWITLYFNKISESQKFKNIKGRSKKNTHTNTQFGKLQVGKADAEKSINTTYLFNFEYIHPVVFLYS
jgi:hypothetical protein